MKRKDPITLQNNFTEFLLYTTPNGKVNVEIFLHDENIWATERLREYIIKGFTMNDEKLKDPYNIFGKDYFEEQLARIRNIRSSERRMYQKITDIYAQCSADYRIDNVITKQFFATVQNKLHFAIIGKTAAEIVCERADSTKQHMGLTVWISS